MEIQREIKPFLKKSHQKVSEKIEMGESLAKAIRFERATRLSNQLVLQKKQR